MIILTEGDMGSGTPEIRREEETKRAAHDLELDVHEVLDLGDTRLEDSQANRTTVAYRWSASTGHRSSSHRTTDSRQSGRGRGHADHIACGHVVSHGVNFAHLEKFPVDGPPHAVKKVLYYFLPPFMRPTLIVPVDEEFPQAIKALANHKSQFERQDRPKFFRHD